MAQTSRNRWVNGQKKLKFIPNLGEFRGLSEGGYAVPLGHFEIEAAPSVWLNDPSTWRYEVFSSFERDDLVKGFLELSPKDFWHRFC